MTGSQDCSIKVPVLAVRTCVILILNVVPYVKVDCIVFFCKPIVVDCVSGGGVTSMFITSAWYLPSALAARTTPWPVVVVCVNVFTATNMNKSQWDSVDVATCGALTGSGEMSYTLR